MPIDSRKLTYFVAVAEALHFTRAAELLGIPQPRLSQQIKRLESELGTDLFWRNNRRVELTAAGAVLLEESRKALGQLDLAARRARSAGKGEAGELALGFIDAATYGVLPAHLRRFRKMVPDVRLDLHEMATGPLVKALQSGDIRLAYIRPTIADGIASTPVDSEDLLVALPQDHPLAEHDKIRLGDVQGEPFISIPREVAPSRFDYIVGLFRDVGGPPAIIQSVERPSSTLALVSAGIGLALVPSSLRCLAIPGIVFRPLDDVIATVGLDLAWKQGGGTPAVERYLDICAPQRHGRRATRSRD
jgi:DNA-binding transcriptional LysR family regulator